MLRSLTLQSKQVYYQLLVSIIYAAPTAVLTQCKLHLAAQLTNCCLQTETSDECKPEQIQTNIIRITSQTSIRTWTGMNKKPDVPHRTLT